MKQYRAQAARASKNRHSQKSLYLLMLFAHRPCTDENQSFALDKERKLEIWTD
jgi:hypothetical protein